MIFIELWLNLYKNNQISYGEGIKIYISIENVDHN